MINTRSLRTIKRTYCPTIFERVASSVNSARCFPVDEVASPDVGVLLLYEYDVSYTDISMEPAVLRKSVPHGCAHINGQGVAQTQLCNVPTKTS